MSVVSAPPEVFLVRMELDIPFGSIHPYCWLFYYCFCKRYFSWILSEFWPWMTSAYVYDAYVCKVETFVFFFRFSKLLTVPILFHVEWCFTLNWSLLQEKPTRHWRIGKRWSREGVFHFLTSKWVWVSPQSVNRSRRIHWGQTGLLTPGHTKLHIWHVPQNRNVVKYKSLVPQWSKVRQDKI